MDITKDSLRYEQYYVSDIEDGEWVQYTIKANRSGVYALRIYTASIDKQGIVSITLNDKVIAESLYLPSTGGIKTWKAVELKNIRLTGNSDKLVIKTRQGGYNFRQIEFIRQKG